MEPTITAKLYRRLLGAAIRIRREHLGLSIERAAELAGLNREMWLALEEGDWVPQDELTLRSIASAVEDDYMPVSFMALFCREVDS